MRFRLMSSAALLTLSACAAQPATAPSASAAPTLSAAPAQAWTEPAKYLYTLDSTCGDHPLTGKFAVTVVNGEVTASEGLDDAARRALMLRMANLVPTLGKLVADAEAARADGSTVTVDRDPADGHPTKILIDDDRCYTVSGYLPG